MADGVEINQTDKIDDLYESIDFLQSSDYIQAIYNKLSNDIRTVNEEKIGIRETIEREKNIQFFMRGLEYMRNRILLMLRDGGAITYSRNEFYFSILKSNPILLTYEKGLTMPIHSLVQWDEVKTNICFIDSEYIKTQTGSNLTIMLDNNTPRNKNSTTGILLIKPNTTIWLQKNSYKEKVYFNENEHMQISNIIQAVCSKEIRKIFPDVNFLEVIDDKPIFTTLFYLILNDVANTINKK